MEQQQLDRIEEKLDKLTVSVEHRVSVLEINVLWLKRSFVGLISLGFSVLAYVVQPFF